MRSFFGFSQVRLLHNKPRQGSCCTVSHRKPAEAAVDHISFSVSALGYKDLLFQLIQDIPYISLQMIVSLSDIKYFIPAFFIPSSIFSYHGSDYGCTEGSFQTGTGDIHPALTVLDKGMNII